jgi:RNA polymerase sigma-70 factor (ECF subfamily)
MSASAQPLAVPPSVTTFEALYAREFDYVRRSLRRLGAREAELNDLCHDVFLVAHHRFAEFDQARPARPWLFGIGYRVLLRDRRKASSRLDAGDEALAGLTVPPAGEAQVQAREARELVLAALERLPDERRAVFILHELDGASAPEIATALGVPLNTVYSRLRTARGEFVAVVRRLQGGAQ